jgi:uncharacterized protein (TIGR02569 family)
MQDPPRREVLDSFGVTGPPTLLEGGEGRSWRAGDIVLKPCDDVVEWAWLGERLPSLQQAEFRLALPLRARDDRWVVDGWSAQAAVAGVHAERWNEVLQVGRRFDESMAALPRPDFIDHRTHPWSVGDRVAWEEADPPRDHPLLERLSAIRAPVDLPSQAIHGDLTENVLFADHLPPAVIDVTPYWRPSGYSLAIVAADAIQWFGADPFELLAACADIEAFPQLFVRAVIFRLVTTLVFGHRDGADLERVVGVAERLAG